MNVNVLTTQELDGIARLGLDDLRACFGSNPPEGTKDRADLALKIIGHSNRRYSAETNRLSLTMRLAKMLNLNTDEMRPLWGQIAGASGPVVKETRPALASSASAVSGDNPTAKRSDSKKPGRRSQKAA